MTSLTNDEQFYNNLGQFPAIKTTLSASLNNKPTLESGKDDEHTLKIHRLKEDTEAQDNSGEEAEKVNQFQKLDPAKYMLYHTSSHPIVISNNHSKKDS